MYRNLDRAYIANPIVSLLEKEAKACPCQHFMIAFVPVFMAVTVLTHLCVICHLFICLVLLFQGHVAHQILP